jgi:hypothetical protein
MKKLLILFILPLFTYAQKDSVKVNYSEEVVEKFEKTSILDEYDKAFGGNRTVKSALRVGVQFNSRGNQSHLFASYEHKFGKDFSVNAGVLAAKLNDYRSFKVFIEPRWYFKMKDRISEGTQANNLTGDYVSLRVMGGSFNSYSINVNTYGERLLYTSSNEYHFAEAINYSLNYGRQLGNNVDFTISGGLRYIRESYVDGRGQLVWARYSDKTKYSWFLGTNFRFGTGLFFPRAKGINTNKCDFLLCNYEVKKLFKFNLNNLLSLDPYIKSLGINPEYEFKIGKSPFSLNSSLNLNMSNFWQYKMNYTQSGPILWDGTKENQFEAGMGLSEQIRYYVGMNRRIAKGKSASNLNGFYTAVSGGIGIYYINYPESYRTLFSDDIVDGISRAYTYSFAFGVQKQTAKNSFIDYGISFRPSKYQTTTYVNGIFTKGEEVQTISRNIYLKIGIAK